MGKSILLTGASGFLGYYLASSLVRLGDVSLLSFTQPNPGMTMLDLSDESLSSHTK